MNRQNAQLTEANPNSRPPSEQVQQIEEWILKGLPNKEVKLNARMKYGLKSHQVHDLIHQAWLNLVQRLNKSEQRRRAQSALDS